jgi:hypothetical protein
MILPGKITLHLKDRKRELRCPSWVDYLNSKLLLIKNLYHEKIIT